MLGVLRGLRWDEDLIEEFGGKAEKKVADCQRPTLVFYLVLDRMEHLFIIEYLKSNHSIMHRLSSFFQGP